MASELVDKNVLIIGGGTLGQPAALAAARAGANRVIITSRDSDKARGIAAELSTAIAEERSGFAFESCVADLGSKDGVDASVRNVAGLLNGDPLHGLVIMAGGNNGKANQGLVKGPIAKLHPLDADARREYARSVLCAESAARSLVYHSNVIGPMEFLDGMCREILFAQVPGSSVVFIGSVAPIAVLSGIGAYSGAKAALVIEAQDRANHYSRMCEECGHEPIRVNVLRWGFTDSAQSRGMIVNPENGQFTHRGQLVINRTPLRRLGRPEEVGPPIVFLLSDGSSFVQGAEIAADGGFSVCGSI